MITETYTMNVADLAGLETYIARINRKAEKNGWTGLSYEVVADSFKQNKDEETGEISMTLDVAVSTEVLRFEGWTLNSIIEPENDTVVILTVPGRTAPEWARHSELECQHCKLDRNRAKVVILEHEDGRFIQVGMTCVNDFLNGHSAEKWFRFVETDLMLLDPEDEFGAAMGTVNALDLKVFIAATVQEIELTGWTSRGKAFDTNEAATVDLVMRRFDKAREYGTPVFENAEKRQGYMDRAEKVIQWVRNEWTDESDYAHNVKACMATDGCGIDRIGIVGSSVAAFNREMARRAEAQASPSEWIGTVGKREVFTLKVVTVHSFSGTYGVTHLHNMRDGAGNLVQWFSTNALLEEGVTYTGKATVKAHQNDRRSGQPSTIVNRCKLEAV